jgi:fructose-bisphosphate aldolase class II
MTKKVVDFCHGLGVEVQAELGNVPYIGETCSTEIDWDEYMTDPKQALRFIQETGIDALAVAIGNAHGFVRERTEPDLERLEKINEICDTPLILHGASDWENARVGEVIKRGIACFNVDTATRMAFVGSIINSLKKEESNFDLRKLLGEARDEVKEVVKRKMKYFGSEGKI